MRKGSTHENEQAVDVIGVSLHLVVIVGLEVLLDRPKVDIWLRRPRLFM